MTEIVIAVFEVSSAADAAVRDLEATRIPSAVIRREVGGDRERHEDGSASVWQSSASAWLTKRSRGSPSVMVAVDEMHAAAVTGILNQYGPLEIEERAAPKPPTLILQAGNCSVVVVRHGGQAMPD